MLTLTLGPSGIAVLPPRRFEVTLCERCSLSRQRFRRAVAELQAADLVVIEGSVVWNRHQLRNDPFFSPTNPKHVAKIRREVALLPNFLDNGAVRAFWNEYVEYLPDPDGWNGSDPAE
jgi:hypothetical protein